ncbi:MAG: AMP-binding protein, partial [Pseudomonadota bacterium]
PAPLSRKPGSIGRAIPFADVRVVDENGHECAPGEVGEITHAGPLVAQGYWADEVRTSERFQPPPPAFQSSEAIDQEAPRVVRSGDYGYADEEGDLFFLGRRDDMIKISGYRTSPTEIEEVALASGPVHECVAFGLKVDMVGDPQILLVAVAKPDERADEDKTEAVLSHFHRSAPLYLKPHRVLWRDELPRNPNGKLDRSAIKQSVTSEPEA